MKPISKNFSLFYTNSSKPIGLFETNRKSIAFKLDKTLELIPYYLTTAYAKENIAKAFQFTRFSSIPTPGIILPSASITQRNNQLIVRIIHKHTKEVSYLTLGQNGFVFPGYGIINKDAKISLRQLYQIASHKNSEYELLTRKGFVLRTVINLATSPFTFVAFLAQKITRLIPNIFTTKQAQKDPSLFQRIKNWTSEHRKTSLTCRGIYFNLSNSLWRLCCF